ncbi:MAG: hypothetical protein HY231_22615 [Acidobacteria bacterium]|nr:hypothetical protein [Acidobacteriota bacterium]
MQNLEKPQVRFGEWISEGWKMFTEQWKAWVLNTFIYVLICGTPMLAVIIGFYGYLFTQLFRNPHGAPAIGPEVFITFYLALFAVLFLTLFVAAFFIGGMHRAALKQLRGGTVELRDLFSGGSTYFPILIATILTTVLTMIGSALCIIPGFIVGGCLFFTLPLIVDRRLGAIDAMKASYELVKQNLLMFTLFAFVVQLIASAGSYACYVGLLATIPLLFTISAVAYRDTFGVEGARYFTTNAPPAAGGYAPPLEQRYQPPAPDFGQAAYPPYPNASYGQAGYPPSPNAEYGQAQPPYATPPDRRPITEKLHNPAPPQPTEKLRAPEVAAPLDTLETAAPQTEPVEPLQPRFDATMPLANAPLQMPVAEGLVCANCQMQLPATAGFCPRCGTRVER